MDDIEKDWYSTSQAAKMLSVCRSTLHRWIIEGRFKKDKFWRVGKCYRIDKEYIYLIYTRKTDMLPRIKRGNNVDTSDGGTRDVQNVS